MLVYKITIVDPNKGDDGHDLLGLLVVQIDQRDQDQYFLVDPRYMLEEPQILSTAVNGSFHFPFKDLPSWTLNIDPVSVTHHTIKGTWSNSKTGPPTVDDTWTATGTGIGAGGDDEARAASAK